ncbi:sel1 repeat family protein [bacterium]|nr:sel1 repeat family protein [bacterium]
MKAKLKKTLASFIRHKFSLIFLICLSVNAIGNNCPAAITPTIQPDSPPSNSSEKQTIPLWKQSFDEIKAKAESGDAYAEALLAHNYRIGIGVKQNFLEAYKWAKLSKIQGNPFGKFNLAILYANGEGVDENPQLAIDMFSDSFLDIVVYASKGSAWAQAYLGSMYQNRIELIQNGKKAGIWYKKAAEQGFASAQTELGTFYLNGYHINKNYQKAFNWFKLAARQNHSTAQCNLGVMYLEGYGRKIDYQQAIYWFKKSIEYDNPYCLYNFGHIYFNGLGVQKDYKKAAKYFLDSAKHNYLSAQVTISQMYEKGVGVQKDCKKAINWMTQAKTNGFGNAKREIERLKMNCD